MAGCDPSPETLLARHVAGVDGALEELITQVSPELRQLARRLGADAQQSEDTLQELWLGLLTAPLSYDASRPLLPWLRGMVRLRVRSAQRRERRQGELVRQTPRGVAAADGSGHETAARESEVLVRHALRRLPQRYRAPLELHLLEGLSPVEVSERLALPRASVRVLLHRGRTLLRSNLPRGIFALLLSFLLRTRARAATSAAAAASVVIVLIFVAAQRTGSRAQASQAAAFVEASANSLTAANDSEGTALASQRSLVAPRRELDVRVVHADGRAAANVGLVLAPADGRDPRLHRQFASTDALGRARMVRETLGPVLLTSDRGASTVVEDDRAHAELRVAGGVEVHGLVRAANRTPIANAEVWLGDLGGSRSGQVVARTDNDGEFELSRVPPGASVAAFAAGFRRTEMVRLPAAGADGSSQVELVLEPGGGAVRVVALDERGSPVRGARVFVGKCVDGVPPHLARGLLPAFPPPILGATDEHGVFVASGLEPGTHPIVVRAADFVSTGAVATIVDGASSEHRLLLSRGATVRGRVVDELGEPIAEAQVALRADDPMHSVYLATSRDGEFLAEGLPDAVLALAARAWNHGAVEREARAVPGPSDPIELVLPSTPLCRGVLSDEHGRPLAGYRLRLLGAPSSALSPNSDEGRSDGRGEFELAVIGGEIRRVEVRAENWPQWLVVRRAWMREQGQQLDITVPSDEAPRAWLRGVMRDADGRPLAARKLDLADSEGGVSTNVATTSEAGEFRIGPLLAGRYGVVLAHSGRADRIGPVGLAGEYDVGVGEERVVAIDLERAVAWRGELRFADGAAPSSPIVSLDLPNGAAGVLSWNEPDQSAQLLPGRYALHAMGDDFEWWNDIEVVASPLEAAPRLPALVRASPLSLGVVQLPLDVDAAAGLTVLREPGEECVGRFELRANAERTTLQAFAAHGAYRAVVRRRDGTPCFTSFDVGPAGARPSELRFDP